MFRFAVQVCRSWFIVDIVAIWFRSVSREYVIGRNVNHGESEEGRKFCEVLGCDDVEGTSDGGRSFTNVGFAFGCAMNYDSRGEGLEKLLRRRCIVQVELEKGKESGSSQFGSTARKGLR